MSDRQMDITRRKVLGALGAVGAAGAGAGFGTSALFNDTESFEDNSLVAGTLDLKVDWEEHYSYPQLYGFDDPTSGLDYDLHRSNPEDDAYVGLPDPNSPVVWVHEDDLDTYMANTAIEAFPDPDGDGSQEIDTESFTYAPCGDGADLPADLTPTGGGATRTANPSTTSDGTVDGDPKPLVSLEDVKPGDFGEFTFSFHLCDNPGYLWLQAANVSQSEGGPLTDPEAEVDSSPDDPELAENIQTVWWYDDGNNVIDETVSDADVMIAVDTSSSLTSADIGNLESDANDLANQLAGEGARVGGLTFGGTSVDNFTPLSDSPVQFSGLSQQGSTPMPAALEVAAEELDVNGRSGAETYIVMFTDGGPNYPNSGYDSFPIGGGFTPGDYTSGDSSNSIVEDGELCETANIAADIRADHDILTVGIDDDGAITNNPDAVDCNGNPLSSLGEYLQNDIAGGMDNYYAADSAGTVSSILTDIVSDISMPEQVFRRGTLQDDLAALQAGDGIPLDGDLTTAFDELGDAPDNDGRDCFDPGVTYYIGFGWWLPSDVGNEVQGDSVSFDLGFYTEQCRNNDGSGPT